MIRQRLLLRLVLVGGLWLGEHLESSMVAVAVYRDLEAVDMSVWSMCGVRRAGTYNLSLLCRAVGHLIRIFRCNLGRDIRSWIVISRGLGVEIVIP